jgi:trimeric autotransporter adhesin
MKKTLLVLAATLSFGYANAQMKLGSNPTTTNSNALLEMETTNKGLLLPRVALTSTTAFAPLSAHVAGMAVYNTATAGDVTPGYYFSDGSKWVKVADAATAGGSNIYTANGTLTSARTVTMGANNLSFNGTGNVGIGTTTPTAKLEVVGGDALINTITVGIGSGSGNTNTAIGNSANTGLAANGSVYNTAVGFEAFQMSKGNSNTAVGYQALKQVNLTLNNAGSNNTAVGRNAMTGGASGTDYNFGNTAIGSTTLFSITDAEYNTATGYQALYGLTTGDNNVAYGRQAGDALTTGSGNIAIGTSAQVPTATADNQLSIGNTIYGTGIGTGSANIGIGTSTPTAKLDVAGTVKIVDGTQGAGKVLTSDATGLASWQSTSAATGSLAGAYNPIGTTNLIMAAGAAEADVPGVTQTFTLTKAATVNVIATGIISNYNLAVAAADIQGSFKIDVDGTSMTSAFASSGNRPALAGMATPITLSYNVTLAVGTHTIKLKYKPWNGGANLNLNAFTAGYGGATAIDADALKSRMSILIFNN